jgi:hypothetical protein
MHSKLDTVFEDFLRSVRPRLICRVEPQGDRRYQVTPYINQNEDASVEITSEGYDPTHSLLGCPVYWRIVKRGAEQFYLSTFLATRDQVTRAWGPAGLIYCDPVTGIALARIETKLSNI